jgi:integrase
MRQALGAAVRWHYLSRNPAVEAGKNPEPPQEELLPFTREQVEALADELGPLYGSLVLVAAETGLRTNEWIALERRDLDREGRAVTVQRRYAGGVLTPYSKTAKSRRRVPLTARATWRNREWYPALDAAGIEKRGPYHLRHTSATEALAAGVSIFELARLMGTSVKMIDKTYGHLARDSEDSSGPGWRRAARPTRSGRRVGESPAPRPAR